VRALVDRSKLFSSVKLGGSVDVAETLAFVFRNLKWDAEADLAAVIGDIPAHRLVKIGQSLAGSLQDAARNTAENIREYAVEESAMLIAPSDIRAFGEAVNRLRDDVARLEKRLAQL
jgi:ubiquinone biosynthesis protein UbiJ